MLYHAERVEPLLEEEPQWCDICGNIGADLYLSLTDEYRTPEDQLKEVVSTKFYIHVVCLASRLRVARHDVRDLANQRRANQARRAAHGPRDRPATLTTPEANKALLRRLWQENQEREGHTS